MQGPSRHTVWPQPKEEEQRLLGTWWLKPLRKDRDRDRHALPTRATCTGFRDSHPLLIPPFSL